ncbi:MAG: cytochrome-c oxidase, cbb3-type subunit II [Rhodobiaceae bacterium]|nr:MAG: cytochrome-c oxidase, cbb3-type subunit II [Rhodobiaceae bacterium]
MSKFTHATIEKNSILLLVLTLVVVSIGGLVEIVPTFLIKTTIEDVDGVRPYSPLELAGRDIYVREGCYACHSQMIRALRSEVERYGHYSLAAESKYDHPFQWGSKRTGPDLARVGGKYSDAWHQVHMADPRAVVPESVMPGYPFLAETPLAQHDIENSLKTLAFLGTPYSEEMIAEALSDVFVQQSPDEDYDPMLDRYPGAIVSNFDGDPSTVSELDAMIAYLQMLGTLVDFSAVERSTLVQ